MIHSKTFFIKKTCLALLFCFTLCATGIAQNLIGPTSVVPNSTETYVYNDGTWWFFPLWQVTNGNLIATSQSGSTFTAIVQWGTSSSGSISFWNKTMELENLSVTIYTPQSGLSNENYVHNVTPRVATSNVTNLIDNEKIESVTYFDGLGRPMQQVGIRAGGSSEDIIIHTGYDEFGRQAKEFLPYSDTNYIASYRTNALNATNSHYDAVKYNDDFLGMTTADINPYSEKELEYSPLSRVTKQAAPGNDWKLGNGHEIKMDYDTNIASEVRYYSVTLVKQVFSNVITYTPSLQMFTYYDPNELYKTTTKDENWVSGNNHTTEEFKNKKGQVILKRTYNNGAHDTYYVYDDHGNLAFVLPPKSEPQSAKPDATELSELCYQYKYDDLNRLVEKKIPGKGWEYIVYNKLDQPIMTQDANLDGQNKWLVTKYDVFGRVAYTGIKNTSGDRIYFQSLINNTTTATQYEAKVSSGNGYLNTKYTQTSIPTHINEVLTINYYDNYAFDLAGGYSQPAYNVLPISNPKGLATGSKVRVLDTNDWITSVSYYNDKSMPIFVYSFNDYLNTTDIVKSQLTFDGRVTETTTAHSRTGSSTITTIDKFEYDHANRLTSHKQKINNAALDEVIAENNYDDLGQLESKGVGGKQNASARLQDVNYEYNVRGWLKTINDPSSLGTDLFGFKLNYNSKDYTGTKLYNGNIAETEWKTKKDNVLRWYGYEYDALNRIIEGDASSSNYDLTSVAYDKNGNITSLSRKGHTNAQATSFGIMDNLVYTYETKSNRLKKVLDNGNDNYGFKDGSNITTEYTYDANGNMLRDYNKGITSNITYNHLNLPTQVNLSGGNIQYIYDATGIKQKKIVSTGTTTEYAGNHIYENGTLKMFSHPEGYVNFDLGNKYTPYYYVYQYKDHLGSVRLAYSDLNGNGTIEASTEILKERNTYPFGLEHKGYNNVVNGTENNYQTYLGQEINKELGLNWLTFRYRNYMPELGRFFGVDPISEEFMSISTYQLAHNNPIWKIEIEGLEGEVTTKNTVDIQHHEPVKVQKARGNPFVTTTSTGKAVQETTKQVVKEVAKKPGGWSKFLGLAGRALGTVAAMITPTTMGSGTRYDDQGRDKLDPDYPNVKSYAIDEKLRVDDKTLKPETDSDSPIRRIDDSDAFSIVDEDDGSAILSVDVGEETLEIMGDFVLDGDTLTIDNFSVEGSSSNNVGISAIKSIMKQLGTDFDVKTIVTKGTPRTTGANPGKVTELTFDIDKL